MCKRVLKIQTQTTGEIPFFKIGTFGKRPDAFISEDLYHDYKKRFSYPAKGDVLISASGTIGRKVVFDGKPAYFQDSNIIWISNDESKIVNSYLYYCYDIIDWDKSIEGGTIKRLYNNNLSKIPIPIPPLPLQRKIVEILDQFSELVGEISGGLPDEISARRKQYEYYRAKLLNFKQKSVLHLRYTYGIMEVY